MGFFFYYFLFFWVKPLSRLLFVALYSEIEEELKLVTCLDLWYWIKIPSCYHGNSTLKIRS